ALAGEMRISLDKNYVSIAPLGIEGRSQHVLARQQPSGIVFSPELFQDDLYEGLDANTKEAIRIGTMAEQILLWSRYAGRIHLTAEDRDQLNAKVNDLLANKKLPQIWPLVPRLKIGLVSAMVPDGGLMEYMEQIFLPGYVPLIGDKRADVSVFGHRNWA